MLPRLRQISSRFSPQKMSSYAQGFENAHEQRTPIDLPIHGTIPTWLAGVLYRTGPGTTRIKSTNPAKPESIDVHHWFDGLAMHHRFEIHQSKSPTNENGSSCWTTRVSYRSRKAAEHLEARIAEDAAWPNVSFGQNPDPCQSLFRKFFTIFKDMRPAPHPPHPSSVSVGVTLTPNMPGWNNSPELASTLPIDEEQQTKRKSASGPRYLVAKTDADVLQLIDPDSLEPLAAASYKRIDPRLDGQLSAAHGCRDKVSGAFYNYSCKLGGRFPTYKIFRIAHDGVTDILATITDAPASYIHSIAMTARYVILCVWQAHLTK